MVRKTLLPRTSHALVSGLEEIGLELSGETSSLMLSFHGAKGCYSDRGRKDASGLTQCWVLSAMILDWQMRCAHWCDSGMAVLGGTNQWLDLRPVPQKGIHAGYNESGQKQMAEEAVGPKGEATNIFAGHIVKLAS